MAFLSSFFRSRVCAVALLLFCFAVPGQANAAFRFLSTSASVPEGTTNGEYFFRIFTANAEGPVTFAVKAGCGAQCETLPTGILLNTQTGAIYGKPTVVETKDVTITAFDGTTTLDFFIDNFKVSASGGGGNSGASFVTTSLPDGRVGEPYTLTLESQGGVGPFIWGAQDLPVGITLDGTTGLVSGTPVTAGTFYVTFTNNDTGEGNTVITTLPMLIYPGDADADPDAIPPVLPDYMFKFETYMLDNGEIGTAYSDTYLTSGEEGTVTFSATGLPDGLTIDADTGVVSGMPTVAGTFFLTILATDDGTSPSTTITANLAMRIVPSVGSNFYWNYFGVPAALYGIAYDSSLPIVVNTVNGGTVTYSALGLPPGISYNTGTGELSGTPSEVGVFPVVYTATSTSLGQTLTMDTEFIVLPPSGGDVGRLAVNLWIKKLSAKAQTEVAGPPNDSWQAQYIYNADRRTGNIFNPFTQSSLFALGASEVELPAASASMNEKSGDFKYTSPKGEAPVVNITGKPSAQSLSVKVSDTLLGGTLPADMVPNRIILGNKGYKLKTFLDEKGKFTVTSSYRSASFVVSSASVKDVGNSKDTLQFSMYLADPSLLANFLFIDECPDDNKNCNQPTVKLKLHEDSIVLLDKDLTTLVATTRQEDKNALVTYKMKKVVKTDPDVSGENLLSSFSFDSKTGLLKVKLTNLALASALDPAQAHIGVEVTVDNMSYFTSITLFESKQDSDTYNSKVSTYAKPYPVP